MQSMHDGRLQLGYGTVEAPGHQEEALEPARHTPSISGSGADGRPAAGTTRALWPPTPTHALELPRRCETGRCPRPPRRARPLPPFARQGRPQVAHNLLATARAFDHRVPKPLASSSRTERTAMRLRYVPRTPSGSSPGAGGRIAPLASRCTWEAGTSRSRSRRGTPGRSLLAPPPFEPFQLLSGFTFLLLGVRRLVGYVARALPRVAHRAQMLADGLGRGLHPEALSKNLGKLGGVPGTFFGEFPFHEGPHLLGDPRGVARRRRIEETLEAPLFPA